MRDKPRIFIARVFKFRQQLAKLEVILDYKLRSTGIHVPSSE